MDDFCSALLLWPLFLPASLPSTDTPMTRRGHERGPISSTKQPWQHQHVNINSTRQAIIQRQVKSSQAIHPIHK
jgi:hypothetical protein